MTIDENLPNEPSVKMILESLLFVADMPVTLKQLADSVECTAQEAEEALKSLSVDCQERGLRLQQHRGRIQLVTAPETAPFIERFLGLAQTSKLSAAALEALAIVAYKQPVTRPDIESVRGVSSDGVLRTLMSKGLIEEVGRLETVGHPVLYSTTFDFLQHFGLTSLGDLPQLEIEEDGETDETGDTDGKSAGTDATESL